MVSKKIINFLEKGGIKFELVKHRTVYTATDKAATNAKEKIKPAQITKALVMKMDNQYALVLISANKMLDKNKLKTEVNKWAIKKKKAFEKTDPKAAKKIKAIAKVDFTKEAWMKKNLPGKIGAVPPFSELAKLPVFMDKVLFKEKSIYLGSGEYEFSIKMSPKQYEKLEKNLIKGSFSKTKK